MIVDFEHISHPFLLLTLNRLMLAENCIVKFLLWYCISLIAATWKKTVLEIFLVRILPHSDWIRRDTEYLSVFSPDAEKCGPEKLRIWTPFTQWAPFTKSNHIANKSVYFYMSWTSVLTGFQSLCNIFDALQGALKKFGLHNLWYRTFWS